MWTLQDAKNRFSTVVDAATAGQPQMVSKRGKEAVVVISAQDYAHLVALAGTARGSFVEHLFDFPGLPQPDARVQVTPRAVDF